MVLDSTAAPTVNSINPNNGSNGGGTEVTILGTGFTSANGVYFGYTPQSFLSLVSAEFTVVSDTEITATSPVSTLPLGSGPVDVVVFNANGYSFISENSIFYYIYGGAFSISTVTHIFSNADGSPSSGLVTFTLSDMMTNGSETYMPTRFSAILTEDVLSTIGPLSTSLPLTITTGSNDTFKWEPSGETFTIAAGTLTTVAEAVAALSNAIGSISSERFSTYVTVTAAGSSILFTSVAAGHTDNGHQIKDNTSPSSTPITDLFGTSPITFAGGVDGGQMSQDLVSNMDTDTVPSPPWSTRWRVDFHIDGASQRTYYIKVPAGGNTFDLFDLIPGNQQVG